MNAKEFVYAADGINIPEAFDLTADELNAIKAASGSPFDLISIGFKCGFMRGQDAAADDFKLNMGPVKNRALKVR